MLSDGLRGDGPCGDCGTLENIIWYTDDVLWNEVVRQPNEGRCGVLCIPCFVVRVGASGLVPTGWRLSPEWHWETETEYAARKEREGGAKRA